MYIPLLSPCKNATPPPGTVFALIRYPAYRLYTRDSTNRPKPTSQIIAAGIGVITLDPMDQDSWIVERFLDKIDSMTRVRVDWPRSWGEVKKIVKREGYCGVWGCTNNVYQLYKSKVLKEEYSEGYVNKGELLVKGFEGGVDHDFVVRRTSEVV